MTIYALSTVEGQSGVAIIRVSGPLSKKVINNLTGKEPKPRLATLVKIKTLKNKIIDEGLVVYFPKKQSFTGEEVAEFHIHGSTAIIETLLKELGRIKGLRPAKQGEFTKQAYLNGKMNLLQVEGLSSLIQAETEAQREKALETYLDENSKIHFSWLQELKSALAYIESSIDISEEDIPSSLLNSSKKLIKQTVNKIKKYAPEVIVVSLGVDTFIDDPVGGFKLLSEDFLDIGKKISQLRSPTHFVMEGGYAKAELGINVSNVISGFVE